MRVLCYAAHEFWPMACLAEGIQSLGHRVILRGISGYGPGNYEAADAVVVFGMQPPSPLILKDQRDHQTPVLVMDMGYVHRGDVPKARAYPHRTYWSLGLNGLNGRAHRRTKMPGDRWEALQTPLAPWRETGKHILICGQVPGDAATGPTFDSRDWAVDVARILRRYTDRPLYYRPHPQDQRQRAPKGLSIRPLSLQEDLRDCWAVVAYNSTVLVDATIAGIPTFTCGLGHMVDTVTNVDLAKIESPACPDRQQWAHDLAYRQWTLPECQAGLPWQYWFDTSIKEVDNVATEAPLQDSAVPNGNELENGADHGADPPRPRRGRPPHRTTGEHGLSARG